jgi:geranylgeranyl diphosphate synthase type I
VTGKPAGDDLLARKMTYPVIAALEAGGEAAEALRHAYGGPPAPTEDVAQLRALVERTGARTLTEAMAEREERAALAALRAAGLAEGALALCGEFARVAVGRDS